MCMKVYLKYVLIRGGVLSMRLDGLLVIIKLLVDNWDLILRVSEDRIMYMQIDQEFSPIYTIFGEREQANLVVSTGRFFYIFI